MRILTIRQPWLWAIVHQGKNIENRSQRTHYRGPVFLHASKRCEFNYHYQATLWMMRRIGLTNDVFPATGALPLGRIVAVADLTDCVTTSSSPWFEGPFGWVLENVRELKEPIVCKGRLGLWKPDAEFGKLLEVAN